MKKKKIFVEYISNSLNGNNFFVNGNSSFVEHIKVFYEVL